MEEEYVLYYEDYLKIREANRCWKEYWVRLQNTTLVLFEDKGCFTEEVCKKIELSSNSRCVLAKRRTYSFRFRVTTVDGSCLLKCDSNLQRHRWIRMIQLAIKQKPPQSPPTFIPLPYNYDEVDSDVENRLSKDETEFKGEGKNSATAGSLEFMEEKPKVDKNICWTNSLPRKKEFDFLEKQHSSLFGKFTIIRVTREAVQKLMKPDKSDHAREAESSSSLNTKRGGISVTVNGMENLGFTDDDLDINATEDLDCSLSDFPAVRRIMVESVSTA